MTGFEMNSFSKMDEVRSEDSQQTNDKAAGGEPEDQVQLKSYQDRLPILRSVIVFRRAVAICLLASSTAILYGFQNTISASIIGE